MMAIKEFVSEALTQSEWEEFQEHCSENRLNPYEEMRELIYSSYAKMLRNDVPADRTNLAKSRNDEYRPA